MRGLSPVPPPAAASPAAPSRRQRRIIFLSCFILLFIVVAIGGQRPTSRRFAKATLKHIYDHIELEEEHGDSETRLLPCAKLPGASDVMVVMKTGGTEVHSKLPYHLKTTFRCMPHYRIYSDLSETVLGHDIHDALDTLPPSIVEKYGEFDLYRAMQAAQDNELNVSTLAHTGNDEQNLGWDLDKWKFLPLIEKAHAQKPDAKWYVFIEADTFLMWSNLLRYLSFLDPSKPEYRGGPAWLGDIFAHGGSGFILSAETVRIAVAALKQNPSFYEMPHKECCGDFVLSKFLKQVGVNFTSSYPLIQGESPATLDYTEEKWSRPVISYHHVGKDTVEELWKFEQGWLRAQAEAESHSTPKSRHTKYPPILHRDIFSAFVAPLIYPASGLDDWDNLSHDRVLTSSSSSFSSGDDDTDDDYPNDDDDKNHEDSRTPTQKTLDAHAPTSLAACEKACLADDECKQFSFRTGECRIGYAVRLGREDLAREREGGGGKGGGEGGEGEGEGKGEVKMGLRSRWIKERIEALRVKAVGEAVWWSEERLFHTEN